MLAVVVNTALRPQKPDGLLGTERAPLTSSDTQSRELSEMLAGKPLTLSTQDSAGVPPPPGPPALTERLNTQES